MYLNCMFYPNLRLCGMVRLESYECFYCQEPYKLYYKNGKQTLPTWCSNCERLVCGECESVLIENEGNRPKCEDSASECDLCCSFDPYIAYFQKFAPDDELQLLNFAKWSPDWCDFCDQPITVERRLVLIHPSMCSDCTPVETPLDFNVTCYMRVIDELSGYFGNSPNQQFMRICNVIQLDTLKCGICNQRGRLIDGCVTENGLLVFDCCKLSGEKCYDICLSENAAMFNTLLHYIPDAQDLKLLTYSNWTPLRCEACFRPFEESEHKLPIFNVESYKLTCSMCSSARDRTGENDTQEIILMFLLDIIREFRSLFKDNTIVATGPANRTSEVVCVPEVTHDYQPHVLCQAEESIYDSELLLRGRGVNFLRSTTMKCTQCGVVEDISKFHNCLTCEMRIICQACVINKHWGHEVPSSMPNIVGSVVQEHHELTVGKLKEWGNALQGLSKEGREVHNRLCDGYSDLFTTAAKESDLNKVCDIMNDANVEQLRDLVSNFTTAQIKLNIGLKTFCEKIESLRGELDE